MYQFFIEHFIVPLGDFINRSKFYSYLRFWRRLDGFSENELRDLQRKRLGNILRHAVKNSSAYKNISLEGVDPYNWLKKFPILTKNNLRSRPESFLTESKSNLKKISSSGSSGISSSVFMNSRDLASLRAGLIHWWEWYDYKMGNPIIQTGITPNRSLLKSIKDFFFRTIYISAFAHSEEQIIAILKKVNESKSEYILAGYASSLNLIATIADRQSYNIQFKSVISLGDKLFSHYRKNIEKTFNCKVFDTYGSAEGFLIGAQFDLEYLYILSPQTYVEILDDNDNPVPDGTLGHLVVTRLDGYAMPLIRYKLGDLGIMLPLEKYPKNRKFQYPLLQQIIGRDTDVVKTKGGKTLVVHSFTGIFEYVPEIEQFKIIQKNSNEITILYIKAEGFCDETLSKIKNKLQSFIKEPTFQIHFEEVNEIKPTKSGKPQIIESHL